MALAQSQQVLLKKLKKQVRLLQRKEEQGRHKLRSALKKMRKMGRIYKIKLASKLRSMKGKVADVQSSTYAKIAADIERQMLRSIKAKTKALAQAAARIEKKHATKLTKRVAKKAKNNSRTKATDKPTTRKQAMKRSKRIRRKASRQ